MEIFEKIIAWKTSLVLLSTIHKQYNNIEKLNVLISKLLMMRWLIVGDSNAMLMQIMQQNDRMIDKHLLTELLMIKISDL